MKPHWLRHAIAAVALIVCASAVQAAEAPASGCTGAKPELPAGVLHTGQGGIVAVEGIADGKGGWQSVRVTQSSGSPLLDEAAVKALSAVRCTTMKSGLMVQQEFNFSVDDEKPAKGNGPKNDADFCEPTGPAPEFPEALKDKAGWVTVRMHVHPGATPVSDVRVVSEAGGPLPAKAALAAMRQWMGCARNTHDTLLEETIDFDLKGEGRKPPPEGFGLHAFKPPAVAPSLRAGDDGAGVCPIRARLKLLQPASDNQIIRIESRSNESIDAWLKTLVPDRDYMVPNPDGNRVEISCKVDNAGLIFSER